MNSSKSGARSILAAAAAGALILGSAGGAIADPGKAKGPKAVIQLTKVDIHRHSPINVNADAVTRDLNVRATVRDTDKIEDPSGLKITVSQFTGKKTRALTSEGATFDVTTFDAQAKKRSTRYTGRVSGADIRTAFTGLELGAVAYLCINTVAVDGTTKDATRQVTRKANGGDCVRIVNVDPAASKTESDDATAKTAP